MKRWQWLSLSLAVATLVLVGMLVWRAMLLPDALHGASPGPSAAVQASIDAVDPDAVAEHIAQAIRFQTVSRADGQHDKAAFLALHAWLAQTYPMANSVLERSVINELSLIYRWPSGNDCSAAGFVSHLDVVPIESGTLNDWTHPPFAGALADGFIWGRGAVDTKDNLIYIMEAAEQLARSGFTPACDLYFLFGHDEEVGGTHGAVASAERLRQQGVGFAWILDEAGGIGMNLDGSTTPPMATVQVSTQGYLTLRLTAKAAGGHSASGTEDTAITRLAEAVLTLRHQPMPGGLDGSATHDIRARAAGGAFSMKLLAANLWLTRPLAEYVIESMGGRGMLRTTMAATVTSGGEQENLLLQSAYALVNARLHPRDTVASVLTAVSAKLNPDHITVSVEGMAANPTPAVHPEHPAFRQLARTLAAVLGQVRVVPAFGFGGIDGRHYRDLTDALLSFDFTPIDSSQGQHDTDEKLDTRYLSEAVVFYQLMMSQHGRQNPLQAGSGS